MRCRLVEPDADKEAGDLFWRKCASQESRGVCIWGWTNCPGQHLVAVLPGGCHWDIGGRASNCTMPTDTEHRCWVLHGEPPVVTVDKNGLTCGAGAGSIAVAGYHGFLRGGQLLSA